MGEVVAITKPLDKLVLEIRAHVHDAGKAETTCAKHQLQAGWRLLALRERIEAGEGGEISWWDYFDTQFTGHIKSRKYAEQLMKWARSDDPEGAREADRTSQREAMRASRERAAAEQADGCHVTSNAVPPFAREPDYDIVEHAMSIVRRMRTEERERFDEYYQREF